MENLKKKLDLALKSCENKLASDIVSLDVSKMTSIADYFIIVTGTSVSQTQAIADEVDYRLEKEGYLPRGKEGYRDGKWIVLDYNDLVVHIFHKDFRDYYNLEKLWRQENN